MARPPPPLHPLVAEERSGEAAAHRVDDTHLRLSAPVRRVAAPTRVQIVAPLPIRRRYPARSSGEMGDS